jgi:hypothetical protein
MAAGLRIQKIHEKNAAAIVQIPIGDYVAADKQGNDVRNTPNYLQNRFYQSRMDGERTIDKIWQAEYVEWLVKNYGSKELHFALDNEPDSWFDTHNILFPKEPTYEEFLQRSINAAKVIRQFAPNNKIFGPVLTGWYGLRTLGRNDLDPRFFTDYYLAEMKKASDQAGKRLLDVFDFHWYPEHQSEDNIRIVFPGEDNHSPSVVKARLEAPRSLNDSSFVERSWITNAGNLNGPVNLLPRLKQSIANNFPGTALAITEYYFGGGGHISGAIAQADVLGIFGREGVHTANLWHLGQSDDRYIFGAFKLYKDFGFVGINTTSSDPNVSIYTAQQDNKTNVIVVNKTDKRKTVAFNFSGTNRVYAIRSIREVIDNAWDGVDRALTGNDYWVNPMSVTRFVLE